MSTAQARLKPPKYVSRAISLGLLVLLVCGLGGAFAAETIVDAIGRAVDHNELVLRALGWCWTGLPFVLLVTAVLFRRRITANAKHVTTCVLIAWLASSALLLPPRSSDLEDRLGTAYTDGRFLAYGWAAGLLASIAAVLLGMIGVLLAHRLFGARGQRTFGWILACLATLLVAAGLAVALTGPLP